MATKLERATRMLQWLQERGGYVHPAAEIRDGTCSRCGQVTLRPNTKYPDFGRHD